MREIVHRTNCPLARSFWAALLGASLLAWASCGGGETPPAEPRASIDIRLDAFVAQAGAEPERIALLIGIGAYAHSGLPDLPGARNDVEIVQRLLTERFGYAEKDVLVLLDEEATHRNIVSAFERALLDRARTDTEVFVYLAGHGSRIRDESGALAAEPDALDSTFVAYDSRSDGRRGERDLSDDELRSMLAALTVKTAHVTVVTDSCHSGELVRGGAARAVPDGVVGLDLDWVRSIWPRNAELTEDGPGELLDGTRYVHIAASRRDQAAREIMAVVDGEERSFGALTYYLVRELENAARGATWSQVVDVVAARVRSAAHQSVTVRGNVDRRVFAAGSAPVRGYRAHALNPEQLEIGAGFLVGLRVDSQLEVLDARAQEVLGRAVVERVFPDFAIASWEEPPADTDLVAFRVHETHRGSAEPPLRILRRGAGSLADLSLVRLVDEEDAPAYKVVGMGEDASVETLDGIQIGPAVRATIEEELAFVGLRNLAGERSEYDVRIELRSATDAECQGYEGVIGVPILERDATSVVVLGAREGANTRHAAMLDVTNQSDKSLFVYVLSLEEGRQRQLIGVHSDPLVLEPGETRSVGASIIARPGWSARRPMLDRYLALAFDTRLERAADLEHRPSLTRGNDLGDDLPGVLERLITGKLMRGGERVELSPQGWGVDYVDVLVLSSDE